MDEVSDTGLMALICREGVALGWYYDTAEPPVATIGIGHTAAAGPPNPRVKNTMTVREAFDLFRKDVEKYAETVRRTIKPPMAQHEFDAFVSICYNIGQGGFASSSFARFFNAGDKAGCAKAIMWWKKPASIIGRRKQERDQFLGKKQTRFSAQLYQPGRNGRLGARSTIDLVRELQIGTASESPAPAQQPKSGQPQKPTQKPADAPKPRSKATGLAVVVAAFGAAALAFSNWFGGWF